MLEQPAEGFGEVEALPEQIGRYQVLGRLGRGANGEVFVCHDPVLDRPLALKALHPNLAGELRAALLQRFWIEVRVRGRLSHPHLVDVYDAGIDGDRPYLVMELCAGPTLQSVIAQRGPLPLSQAMWVFRQVVEALDYIHGMGVIHRDLKPENLLFDGHILKLTDFGAAHLASDEARELEMIGTPEFMAPEQVTGVPVDHHTDLYAAGVLLFELLAGCPPFRGDAMDVLHRIALEEAPRFSSVAPGYPPALDDFFCRALQRDPEKRFGSGQGMIEALLDIFPDVTPQPIRGLEALAELAQAHGQETVRFTGSDLFIPGMDSAGTESESGMEGWLPAIDMPSDAAPWSPGVDVPTDAAAWTPGKSIDVPVRPLEVDVDEGPARRGLLPPSERSAPSGRSGGNREIRASSRGRRDEAGRGGQLEVGSPPLVGIDGHMELRSVWLRVGSSFGRFWQWLPVHRGVTRGLAATAAVVGIAGCLVSGAMSDEVDDSRTGMQTQTLLAAGMPPISSAALAATRSGEGPRSGQRSRIDEQSASSRPEAHPGAGNPSTALRAASASSLAAVFPAASAAHLVSGARVAKATSIATAAPRPPESTASRPARDAVGPLLRHQRPQTALAGHPLVLDLELTPGLSGCRVVSSWRQGQGDWEPLVVRPLGACRYQVRLRPSIGPLDYRFQVLDPGGKAVTEARYQIDVRAPTATSSLEQAPLRNTMAVCRRDPGACYGKSSPAAMF